MRLLTPACYPKLTSLKFTRFFCIPQFNLLAKHLFCIPVYILTIHKDTENNDKNSVSQMLIHNHSRRYRLVNDSSDCFFIKRIKGTKSFVHDADYTSLYAFESLKQTCLSHAVPKKKIIPFVLARLGFTLSFLAPKPKDTKQKPKG